MGNRATIAVHQTKGSPAIYLHWNGGPESVLAFLHAAKELGVRSPASDPEYCLSRLGQIIGNFFGGTTSFGFGQVGLLDDSDNGTYFIGGDFAIIKRTHQGAKTVEELNEGDREKYMNIKALIIRCQRAAFDDTEYEKDIVISRVAKEVNHA